MPTYEYQCDACGHRFDEFQSMTARTLRKCPKCGKNRLKRLIGIGGGVIFKGSGFYETDYRSDSYKKAASADSAKPAEAKTDSKTDTKTDGKSGGKAETPAAKPAESPKPSTGKGGGSGGGKSKE